MSRYELQRRDRASRTTRGAVGWDRPLQTFFAQLFSINEEGKEEAHICLGISPHELDTGAAAIAVVSAECFIPDELAKTLETDRLVSLGTFDSPEQAKMKASFVQRPLA